MTDARPGARVAAEWTIVALGAVVALYFGRDVLIPVAVAVLIWFLIGALAGAAARGLRLRRPPVLLKIAVAILFLAAVIALGRVLGANLVRIGGEFDLDRSPLIGRVMAAAASFGLPAEFDLRSLAAFWPLPDLVGTAASVLRDLVSDASLVFLYVLFLMIDERYFDAKMRAVFPDPVRRRRARVRLRRIAAEARIYLWLMFQLSFGVGLATFAASALFGLEGAAFWGVLAFVLNFIPTIGSILAVVAPAAFALLVFEDPLALLGLLGVLAATQFVAGELVMPRLMANSLNLSAVVILLALVAWGALWGPVGMFLGIPVTVIAMRVFADFPRGRVVAAMLSKDGRLPGRRR